MLTITIKANVPASEAQGIKERIAMDIERYGDCKVMSIVSDRGREEQLKMGDIGHRDPTGPRGPIGRSSAGAVKSTGRIIPIPGHGKYVKEAYITQLKELFDEIGAAN